jgi:hypothetical protein
MAVEKDPTLAPLAEQHLQQRQQQPAGQPAAAATSMLGPSLASLPNSSKPPWLRQRAPQGEKYGQLFEQMRTLKLATVCEEAQCPNIGECWNGSMGERQQQRQLALLSCKHHADSTCSICSDLDGSWHGVCAVDAPGSAVLACICLAGTAVREHLVGPPIHSWHSFMMVA